MSITSQEEAYRVCDRLSRYIFTIKDRVTVGQQVLLINEKFGFDEDDLAGVLDTIVPEIVDVMLFCIQNEHSSDVCDIRSTLDQIIFDVEKLVDRPFKELVSESIEFYEFSASYETDAERLGSLLVLSMLYRMQARLVPERADELQQLADRIDVYCSDVSLLRQSVAHSWARGRSGLDRDTIIFKHVADEFTLLDDMFTAEIGEDHV